MFSFFKHLPLSRSLLSTLVVGILGCSAISAKVPPSNTLQRGACDPLPCLTLNIQDPPELPETIKSPASGAITASLNALLYAPVDNDIEAEISRAALIQDVSNRFEEEAAAGKQGSQSTAWQLIRSAQIVFQNEDVLTVDARSHGYLGGAHGFDERTLVTFDLRDGHKVGLDELIAPNSRSVLASVAEVEFRRIRNVPAGQSLQEAGFSFPPGETFKIPENFGVTASGLVIFYNPYDIASFALGATEVTLPREAIEPLLRSDSPLTARLLAPSTPTLPTS
jgi:hypothetical protein